MEEEVSRQVETRNVAEVILAIVGTVMGPGIIVVEKTPVTEGEMIQEIENTINQKGKMTIVIRKIGTARKSITTRILMTKTEKSLNGISMTQRSETMKMTRIGDTIAATVTDRTKSAGNAEGLQAMVNLNQLATICSVRPPPSAGR